MKKIFKMAAFLLAMGAMTSTFTACEESEDDTDSAAVSEVINTDNFKIKANADGTITFIGDVSSNAKIKTFQLVNSEGTVVYDFVKSNDQVKEKLEAIADDGTVTKEKVFSLTNITSDAIPVDFYTLNIKTKDAETSAEIGEELTYTIGASKSEAGSYLSIVNNAQYTQDKAKENSAEVIAVSSEDGYSVTGLKPASKAKDSEVAAKAGKVALFQGNAQVEQVSEGGVIITESGCICKIVSFKNTSTGDATVVATTIKATSGLTVDVSGYTFSK